MRCCRRLPFDVEFRTKYPDVKLATDETCSDFLSGAYTQLLQWIIRLSHGRLVLKVLAFYANGYLFSSGFQGVALCSTSARPHHSPRMNL